ncbi:hemolysin family protein [Actinomyces sp. MRS3W]|uniref:hemolysin family protein n=1 Tax=Actinomyces sp. MRS3W TaxID=2800796 RepID=UPI0028FD5063|nr:hemolysin family protein [Actinomyces sp. MRS3W]MDU0349690.1 hemolysin family protein [Actinomyces sp. MRS3W]
MKEWLMIAVGVVLTAGTALFVAGEFSLVALDPSTVETRAVAGDRGAARVRRALGRLSTLLSGAQVGITLTTILLGYTMQAALATLLTNLMSTWLAQSVAAGVAAAAALIIVNAFSMVVGELIPKNATLSDPLLAARTVAPFLMGFSTALKPVIAVLNGTANRVLRRMGIEPAEEISGTRSASELAALVRHSAEEGVLDLSTAALLTRSIGVGELTAVDVMTDRGRLHTLTEQDTADRVVALARATGHSRFPVIGDDSDDVLGIVHLRRAIAVPYERRAEVPVTSSSLMTSARRVPETMPLASLLVELRDTGSQMALVVDEYGGTAGVVTLEDAVEEIVGDVADEHDRRRSGAHADSAGDWLVPGWLRPDELAARAGVRVPDDGPYETLAGLVMTELGRIPDIGDEVATPQAVLRVEAMEGRRITRLRVHPLTDPRRQTTGPTLPDAAGGEEPTR